MYIWWRLLTAIPREFHRFFSIIPDPVGGTVSVNFQNVFIDSSTLLGFECVGIDSATDTAELSLRGIKDRVHENVEDEMQNVTSTVLVSRSAGVTDFRLWLSRTGCPGRSYAQKGLEGRRGIWDRFMSTRGQ
jgi:hypothetical protein